MNSTLRIKELFRYSVKSGMAERLSETLVDFLGLIGDRRFMIVDHRGYFITARKEPKLLRLQINRIDQALKLTCANDDPIRFRITDKPRQATIRIWNRELLTDSLSPEIDSWLSEYLGYPAYLVENNPHTRDLAEKRYPWGPIFSDGYPLLLTTTASLDALNQAAGSDFEILRFRPNIVLDTAHPWQEHQWSRLKIGEVILRSEKPCERCVLITRDPVTGEKDPGQEPLKTLAQLNRLDTGAICFGQNFSVIQSGSIRQGDTVELLD